MTWLSVRNFQTDAREKKNKCEKNFYDSITTVFVSRSFGLFFFNFRFRELFMLFVQYIELDKHFVEQISY